MHGVWYHGGFFFKIKNKNKTLLNRRKKYHLIIYHKIWLEKKISIYKIKK